MNTDLYNVTFWAVISSKGDRESFTRNKSEFVESYFTRSEAEREAKSLAKKNRNVRYYVLKSVSGIQAMNPNGKLHTTTHDAATVASSYAALKELYKDPA